jgi:hypothetical protein
MLAAVRLGIHLSACSVLPGQLYQTGLTVGEMSGKVPCSAVSLLTDSSNRVTANWHEVFVILVSFGPRADQYRAYVGDRTGRRPPGTNGPVIDVKTFYARTRDRYCPATYSLFSLLGPLAALALAVGLIDWLLSLRPGNLLLTATPVPPKESTPPLPFVAFCGMEQQHDPLLNGAFASTFHFAVTHVAQILICALALVGAAASIRNVLETHKVLPSYRGLLRFAAAYVAPVAAGGIAFWLASAAVGDRIQGLFERLFPISEASLKAIQKCDELLALHSLQEQLYLQMRWGALGVSIGVVSLILAAALLAWRFETNNINGAWSDSYVLRHKLNSLLTLFFIGSVLLVVTNIALASAMDWTSGVLDLVHATTVQDGEPKGIAAEFASLKALKTSISSFAGGLGSLILILVFTPALYGVSSEIEIAGKVHASYDMAGVSPAPPPPAASTTPIIVLVTKSLADGGRSYKLEIVADPGAAKAAPEADVAGWKTVQDWKEKHGLKLSFSDFTGGFIAALAPLLSGSVIDLTKMTVGAIS